MKEFIEKLIGRLEELKEEEYYKAIEGSGNAGIRNNAFYDAIEIVNQLAEEYNNGWIPCTEKLPKDDSICIVTVEYPNNETVVDYGWFDRIGICWFVGMQEFRTSNILAWQPLPQPYQPKGE